MRTMVMSSISVVEATTSRLHVLHLFHPCVINSRALPRRRPRRRQRLLHCPVPRPRDEGWAPVEFPVVVAAGAAFADALLQVVRLRISSSA
jgi:hypothetical protein